MRHKVFGKKLNRDIKERRALFKNLILALITHGKIRTTAAKAKAIISLAEKLVTHAKEGSNSAIRQISSVLNRQEAINKLIDDIAPMFKNKIGGYLRIIKLGKRKGDGAEEVILEWTAQEQKELKTISKKQPEKKA